jgi:signal transduction histidine kinase
MKPLALVGTAPLVIECVPDASRVGNVEMDRGRIKQALLNLVENALAATPTSGRVVLRATRNLDEGALLLEVEDTGKGMSAETLEKAFTPFFTTKEKGSGLGLPLVRKLARDHGGDALVLSVVD